MNRRQFGKLALNGAMAAGAAPLVEGSSSAPSSETAGSPDPQPRFDPTILSIRRHMSPEWYNDAKFGMFIDYGLYSIAGYAPKKEQGAMYPDWYLTNMYHDPVVAEYHKKTWGETFQRDDFIPKFTAEHFDPEAIAQIASDAGMRYVVPFCKHHDGFCLWPSSYTRRNVAEMGPHRDLIGPLNAACRKRELKFGFYFSIEEWEYPILEEGRKMARIWNTVTGPPHQVVPYDEKFMAGKVTGKIPVKDFFGEYIIPQAKEFIDKYDPDLIWFDGEWLTDVNQTRTPEIVSYFYNRAAGHKEVASNDRLGESTRFNVGDFYSSEYGSLENPQSKLVHKWEECRGVSQSFGYNWQDTEKNIIDLADLIDMLARIVSQGGNLLLVVNLDGKGAMPEYIRVRLREIGQWLKLNGEAIYGTRPWISASQGDNLRFTQSKDRRYLYAIYKEWPEGEAAIDGLLLDTSATIQILGTGATVKWRQTLARDSKNSRVILERPARLKAQADPSNATVLKIQLTS